jgi:hypothetical protein
MANDNREVLASDRNVMDRFGGDWRDDDFRKEYFKTLDVWHKCHTGPLQEWAIFPLAVKYQRKLTPVDPPKKTPALAK